MNKNDIIKYVMQNPDNTNPIILSGMLDEISSSRGGGDVLILHEDPDTHNLDKTAAEIYEASAQMLVIIEISATPSEGIIGTWRYPLAMSVHYEQAETEASPHYVFDFGGEFWYYAMQGSDYPWNADYDGPDVSVHMT